MESRKRRQKSCREIALARARQTQRQKKHPILIGWAFIAALLSLRMPVMQQSDADNDWPISDYERGYTTSPKPRRERYSEQPTLKRLMRDLRRPAAQEDAMQFLLARIDDVALRDWIIEQICEGQINRLAIHVHPNLPDPIVVASWQAEFYAENIAHDEITNDTEQTHSTPNIR